MSVACERFWVSPQGCNAVTAVLFYVDAALVGCGHVSGLLMRHMRLELRNVGTKYPFERSRRFPAIQPNSGDGDRSRLSCEVGDTQLGP
jgi:hypothetical protein